MHGAWSFSSRLVHCSMLYGLLTISSKSYAEFFSRTIKKTTICDIIDTRIINSREKASSNPYVDLAKYIARHRNQNAMKLCTIHDDLFSFSQI